MEALNIKDLSFRYDSKSVVFKNLSLFLVCIHNRP